MQVLGEANTKDVSFLAKENWFYIWADRDGKDTHVLFLCSYSVQEKGFSQFSEMSVLVLGGVIKKKTKQLFVLLSTDSTLGARKKIIVFSTAARLQTKHISDFPCALLEISFNFWHADSHH